MPFRRSPSREVYSEINLPRVERKKRTWFTLLAAFIIALLLLLCSALYFRKLSSEMAISTARDTITYAVSDVVSRVMAEHDYGYDYFVTLEKDSEGSIIAVTANTVHINALASEVLSEMVKEAKSGKLDIHIALGDLLSFNLLLGRGPEIPVHITMLTSSFISFDNALSSTGINQSRHTMTLKASVDVEVLIPWGAMNATVETDVLVAETVIVGRVPETYVNVEDTNGT